MARELASKSIVTNSSITFGRPFKQGRNPFSLTMDSWKTINKLTPMEIPLDDKFLRGKLAPIGEYWLQLVAKDILKLEEGQVATTIYSQLKDKSEVDTALNKIRPKPHYPPISTAFQLFFKEYNKAYPDSNPDELSVFLTTLVDKISDKIVSTGGVTVAEKQEREVDEFIKFTSKTLPEIIKLVNEGISVNLDTGEITHNFVAAYKTKVDGYLFANPSDLLHMVIKLADGRNISNELKGIEKSELKSIEDNVIQDLTRKIPTGSPNAKSIINYILNAHVEAYGNAIIGELLNTVEEEEGDVDVVDVLTEKPKPLSPYKTKKRTVEEQGQSEILQDEKAKEKGFESHANMLEEQRGQKQKRNIAAGKKYEEEGLTISEKDQKILDRRKVTGEPSNRRKELEEEMKTISVPKTDAQGKPVTEETKYIDSKGKWAKGKRQIMEDKEVPAHTEEEIEYLITGKKDTIGKSDILKTDTGLILESINSKEKKRIKALLQHADPTEYFGQDFLKLGELIDVMKKLGVVKGNVKLDKKIIRYDENLKVVKLASRLRKLYEGLYRDLRELVYPNKGGKLR